MRVGLGKRSCSATLNCHAGRRGRSLWGGRPSRLREAVVWVPEGLEAAGVFVPAEACGTSSAAGTCAACSGSRSADIQLRRVRGCLQQAPGSSVTPDESASATAGSTPSRPRFDLPRFQGGFRVEAEGHSASGGGSEAVLPTSWTARTGDSASGKDAVVWRGRQC